MTNEEKVLAVWPDAREVQLRRGKWLIAHGNDPELPGYSILGPEFASIEAAWQNAAESLSADPEQETKGPQPLESYFKEAYRRTLESERKLLLQLSDVASLHADIIDQGRKVQIAASGESKYGAMSDSDFIEWALGKLEGK